MKTHKSSLFARFVALGRLVIPPPVITWLLVAAALTFLPWDAFAQGVPNVHQTEGALLAEFRTAGNNDTVRTTHRENSS